MGRDERLMSDADVNFYFDPLCPFAWMTSKWVRIVTAQRGYTVDWRFISLRMLNSHIDYDTHFSAGYEAGHTAGLRLLRVAAKARAKHRRSAVGPLPELTKRCTASRSMPANPGPMPLVWRRFTVSRNSCAVWWTCTSCAASASSAGRSGFRRTCRVEARLRKYGVTADSGGRAGSVSASSRD
jgi:hypothetical protein